MEEAGCGAQFRAAVRIIQGLPRSGSYRPSYEEMLRFYSYYKQATAGRCQGPRPGFWDPIGRYKWDAWHSLGRMSKEEAMAAYVAEMKKVAQKVIDTVPMDEAARDVFAALAPLYEVIGDLPRPPGALLARGAGDVEQEPGPRQDGQEGSPARDRLESTLAEEEPRTEQVAGGSCAAAAQAPEGGRVPSDSEGDVYCDTLEHMEPEQAGQGLSPRGTCAGHQGSGGSGAGSSGPGPERGAQPAAGQQDSPGDTERDTEGDAEGDTEGHLELAQEVAAELGAQVAGTVRALQDDMRRVRERLGRLETLAAAQGGECEALPRPPLAAQLPWPLPVSPRTLLFLLAWPFVAQWLLRRLQARKR